MSIIKPETPPIPSEHGTYVLKIKTCPVCKGSQLVKNPLWIGYEAWLKQRTTFDDDTHRETFFKKRLNLSTEPPMWEDCPKCNKAGSIAVWEKQNP